MDGTCWVSRVRDGEVHTERSDQVAATVLFAADVTAWTSVAVAEDVAAPAFDAFVARCARAAGLDVREPFPFVVEGELLDLDVHVLAGECPIRARLLAVPMRSPPWAARFDRVRGRLVGIHATGGGGVITHRGATTHVHAVVEDVAGGQRSFHRSLRCGWRRCRCGAALAGGVGWRGSSLKTRDVGRGTARYPTARSTGSCACTSK